MLRILRGLITKFNLNNKLNKNLNKTITKLSIYKIAYTKHILDIIEKTRNENIEIKMYDTNIIRMSIRVFFSQNTAKSSLYTKDNIRLTDKYTNIITNINMYISLIVKSINKALYILYQVNIN